MGPGHSPSDESIHQTNGFDGDFAAAHRHDCWWKIKWLYETRFSQVMSRDRFDSIWQYFHLQGNTVQSSEPDALWKLRWNIDHLVRAFKDVYIPDEHVTTDKSMVKFKGRLAL